MLSNDPTLPSAPDLIQEYDHTDKDNCGQAGNKNRAERRAVGRPRGSTRNAGSDVGAWVAVVAAVGLAVAATVAAAVGKATGAWYGASMVTPVYQMRWKPSWNTACNCSPGLGSAMVVPRNGSHL